MTELELKDKLTIDIGPALYNRITGLADASGVTPENYVIGLIREHIDTAVGKPMINGPSHLSGQATGKVMGPKYAVTRVDNNG